MALALRVVLGLGLECYSDAIRDQRRYVTVMKWLCR